MSHLHDRTTPKARFEENETAAVSMVAIATAKRRKINIHLESLNRLIICSDPPEEDLYETELARAKEEANT